MFSMTGFGEGRARLGSIDVTVEIRTVNHRFLDVNCRLPAFYQRRELDIARLVKERLRRGRVDVTLTRSDETGGSADVTFHSDVFQAYVRIATEALALAKVREPSGVLRLLPGILARREVLESGSDPSLTDQEWEAAEKAIAAAVESLISMRGVEGGALERELSRLLGELEQNVLKLSDESAAQPSQFRDRLKLRLDRLLQDGEVNPGRLAQEVAVLADRTDVTEELARLRSHIEQFRVTMRDAECGRKLEFLLQELGRGINTSGTKSQSVAVAAIVVECKALLEKLRERVLNVE